VAHRHGGEAHAHVVADAGDLEGRLALELPSKRAEILAGPRRRSLGQQLADLLRSSVVERGDQRDRLGDAFEVGCELLALVLSSNMAGPFGGGSGVSRSDPVDSLRRQGRVGGCQRGLSR
jgi:hypothetical protein